MNEQTKLTTLVVIYGGVIGVCYLMGFWNAFNINVFQYADITDVLKATILPLAFVVLGTGITYFSMKAPGLSAPPPGPPKPIVWIDSLIPVFIRWKPAFIGVWLSIGMIAYLFAREPWKWFALFVVAIPFSSLLTDAGFFVALISNRQLRSVLAFIIAPFPFIAIFYGSSDAHTIMDGRAKYLVESKTINLQKVDIKNDKLEYVGFVGNTFFLYDPGSRGLILMKQSDNLVLQLIPNPNK
jgi:hypothetical protein